MFTINISHLRKDLFNKIDNVIEFNDVITVTTEKGNAVIISEEDYNALKDSLYFKKGLKNLIKDGEEEDISSMPVYNPNEKW